MKNDKKPAGIVAALILSGLVAAHVGCRGTAERRHTDAVSKATPQRGTLPPECSTYEVIGWQKGLGYYVIKYNDSMYRNGKPKGREGAEALKKLGIKTIISLVADDAERKLAKDNGFRLAELSFDRKSLTPEVLDQFIEAIDANPGPFYVHCNHGPHRSGSLMVHYRMRKEGWSFEKAAVEFGRLGGDLKRDHAMLEVIRTYGK